MLVVLTIVAVGGIAGLFMYNGLINKKNQVDNVSSGIDALLKKRYELIPNLVASVQGYMVHERELLRELTALRGRAESSGVVAERAEANLRITDTIARILATAEGYPDLKASQTFLQLQAALNETEEQISAARRAYNAAVTRLNNGLEMIPTSFIARAMGLQPRELFAATETERGSVDVAELLRR